jgi:hypothetical protein
MSSAHRIVSTMCNLKEITFACGHKQLCILDLQCTGTFTSSSIATSDESRYPPIFCHAGIQVKTTENATTPCSLTCSRDHALQSLINKYRESISNIEKISERAHTIEKAAEKGPPTLHFTKHGDRGWDTNLLASLCKQAFEEVQNLLLEYSQTKKEIRTELETLILAANSAIKDYTIITDGVASELVFFDERPIVAFGEAARIQLHDSVCEMERRASEACLEEQGWTLPEEDVEQCETLRERVRWKSASLSGTRMDLAYSGTSSKPKITGMN